MFKVFTDVRNETDLLPYLCRSVFGDDYVMIDVVEPDCIAILIQADMSFTEGNFDQKLQKIYDYSKLCRFVFVLESEHNYYLERSIKRTVALGLVNVYYCMPGRNHRDNNTLFYGWHTEMTRLNYRDHLMEDLDGYDPYATKPKSFDALLGTKKWHRDTIYNWVISNNLVDQIYTTYQGADHPSFTVGSGIDFIEPATSAGTHSSSETVRYKEREFRLSQILPMDVYRQTAYSIVAETLYDPGVIFLTEKIAKPIIARKLFVVFSSAYYLENLRHLGFYTFGDVVDEWYDRVEDPVERWNLALEEVRRLMTLDQQEVYAKIQASCEHNYKFLMLKEPYEPLVIGMRDILNINDRSVLVA